MNEALLTKMVKFKLNAASTIVDLLPSKVSEELKDLGRIILDSVNESIQERKEQPAQKPKAEDRLHQVPIE